MSRIFWFFNENVAGIDDTRNMGDLGGTICAHFLNFVFAETRVLGAFVGKGRRPGDGGCVFIVDGCGGSVVDETQFGGKMSYSDWFESVFVSGHNFRLIGALGGLIFFG